MTDNAHLCYLWTSDLSVEEEREGEEGEVTECNICSFLDTSPNSPAVRKMLTNVRAEPLYILPQVSPADNTQGFISEH